MDDSGRRRVVVAGGGLAGLTAAIEAAEGGAEVLLLEKGGPEDIGGNAAFSGGLFLFAYENADDLLAITELRAPGLEADELDVQPYSEADYASELTEMSGGRADPKLVQALVSRSRETMGWLTEQGVEFQFGPFGAYVRDGVLYLPPGQVMNAAGEGWVRGMDLIRPLADRAAALGVEFRYDSPLGELQLEQGRVTGITLAGGDEVIPAAAVVIASGGYQGDTELRRKHLGEGWVEVRLRGTRHSDGDGILAGVRAGAAPAGDWSICHSAAVDPTVPSPRRNDDPSPPPLHGFWFGVMVNREGRRFVDEGPGIWIRNYSRMGKAISAQPGQEAWEIFDQRSAERVAGSFPGAEAIQADSIPELADALGVAADRLEATITEYNRACTAVEADYDIVDGRSTEGIDPPKSNWAAPIDRPPFLAYKATVGITFTFSGLQVDPEGHVLDQGEQPIPGLYAAGEAAGGLFFADYPGGAALMRAAVFGRAAGASAAKQVGGVGG